MIALFAGLWSRIHVYVAIAGAALAILTGAYMIGKQSARTDEIRRSAERIATQARERAHVEGDVAREPDPAERLRRDWSR
ncbi:hypothetical protein EOD42_23180 [Rhodovarius crocodyli]|uniref:Uncharacterized protein n=1 Tax=Rhodovarius crocodyli TaxID=1979269 RepID=A0A437LZ85_9PROT|nr:hypothetical protein [Rhodovarius crocodyli]RVT90707.1 hypothetical protein EOD42_23180 [Rhodovarius crocodyli]